MPSKTPAPAPLTLLERTDIIAAMRCHTCKRAPTVAEQMEMFKSFGRKLTRLSESQRLVWQCPCKPSGFKKQK